MRSEITSGTKKLLAQLSYSVFSTVWQSCINDADGIRYEYTPKFASIADSEQTIDDSRQALLNMLIITGVIIVTNTNE